MYPGWASGVLAVARVVFLRWMSHYPPQPLNLSAQGYLDRRQMAVAREGLSEASGFILVVSVTQASPASPCSALVPEMLVGFYGTSQRLRTRRSLQEARDHHVFALDPLVCTRGLGVGRWDTVLADSDRWGARKFTIGPFTAHPMVQPLRCPVFCDVT